MLPAGVREPDTVRLTALRCEMWWRGEGVHATVTDHGSEDSLAVYGRTGAGIATRSVGEWQSQLFRMLAGDGVPPRGGE